MEDIRERVLDNVWCDTWNNVHDGIHNIVYDSVEYSLWNRVDNNTYNKVKDVAWETMRRNVFLFAEREL